MTNRVALSMLYGMNLAAPADGRRRWRDRRATGFPTAAEAIENLSRNARALAAVCPTAAELAESLTALRMGAGDSLIRPLPADRTARFTEAGEVATYEEDPDALRARRSRPEPRR